MHMLYNSDSYVVVQFQLPGEAGGFEIVDKLARRETYLRGPVAESFQRGVEALVQESPSEETLDDYISGFVQLSQQPVILH